MWALICPADRHDVMEAYTPLMVNTELEWRGYTSLSNQNDSKIENGDYLSIAGEVELSK